MKLTTPTRGAVIIELTPPSFISILENRGNIKISILQGLGHPPPCLLVRFAHDRDPAARLLKRMHAEKATTFNSISRGVARQLISCCW